MHKMILLYQDPKGDRIGTCTATMGITTVTTQTGNAAPMNTALANKVAALEKIITELRNENETLKVSNMLLIVTLLFYFV